MNKISFLFLVCILICFSKTLNLHYQYQANDDDEYSTGQISVIVYTVVGKQYKIDVIPQDTIYVVKTKIQDVYGMPVNQQRLVFKGKVLDNDKTLSYYNIKDWSILHLVLKF